MLFAPTIPAWVDRLFLASADTAPLVNRGEGFYERLVEVASGRVNGELGRTEGLDTSYPTLRPVPYLLTGWRLVAFSAVPEYPATFSFEALQELRVAQINVWQM